MARRRSLRNPMAQLSPKRRSSKGRNGDGRASPVTSPVQSPTPTPGSASPKRRHSFKIFGARAKTPDAIDSSSSPPLNHRVIHNSSPLTISSNSPPVTPTNSPPRSPVLNRSQGQGKLVKSNSHLNISHTATSVSSNSDNYDEPVDNWLLCCRIHCFVHIYILKKEIYYNIMFLLSVMWPVG